MTEHHEQALLFQRVELNTNRHPELRLLHAIPNGGDRNVIVAKKLKREGVRAGVPDLHLPVPRGGYASLYVEMKRLAPRITKTKGVRLDRTRTTAEQDAWIAALREAGNRVEVCYTADGAWDAITSYLAETNDTNRTRPLSGPGETEANRNEEASHAE